MAMTAADGRRGHSAACSEACTHAARPVQRPRQPCPVAHPAAAGAPPARRLPAHRSSRARAHAPPCQQTGPRLPGGSRDHAAAAPSGLCRSLDPGSAARGACCCCCWCWGATPGSCCPSSTPPPAQHPCTAGGQLVSGVATCPPPHTRAPRHAACSCCSAAHMSMLGVRYCSFSVRCTSKWSAMHTAHNTGSARVKAGSVRGSSTRGTASRMHSRSCMRGLHVQRGGTSHQRNCQTGVPQCLQDSWWWRGPARGPPARTRRWRGGATHAGAPCSKAGAREQRQRRWCGC